MKKINIIRIFFAIHLLILLAGFVSPVAESKFYSLNLFYSKGGITLKEITVFSGDIPDTRGGDYKYSVISFNKNILSESTFEIPLTIEIDTFNPETGEFSGETEILDNTDFNLRVPYFPNAEEIRIYSSEDELFLTIDVSKDSLCNEDGICDNSKENSQNCPQDCQVSEASEADMAKNFFKKVVQTITQTVENTIENTKKIFTGGKVGKRVCNQNGICDDDESHEVCPNDCPPEPLSLNAKIFIGVGILLFVMIVGAIAFTIVVLNRKRK